MSGTKSLNFNDIEQGYKLPEFRITIDRETYFAYNKLVNNINPLHADRDYARKLGFEDLVVAGVYTFSFITRMIEDWAGDSARIGSVQIKYQNPIYIDQTIVQNAYVSKKVLKSDEKCLECKVLVTDTRGNELTKAVVKVAVA